MRDEERTAVLDESPDAAAVPSRADDLDPRYRVIGELARGGIGKILRSEDKKLGREIALKRLIDPQETHRRRFANEARITARLSHPAIVPLYDAVDLDGPDPYYTMKLVAGRSLAEVVADTKTLAERIALLPAVTSVAEAVAHAHGRGIIHRDLKPANVLIGDFGETVVIDWGLARATGDAADERGRVVVTDPLRTSAGALLGTPAFMSPEQAAGKVAEATADVYAIGAIVYHALTGQSPYADTPGDQLLSRIIAAPPRPITEVAPDVPPDLAAIVGKAMAHDPRDRYVDAEQLAIDLRRFTTGQLVGAFRYSRRALFRRWIQRYRLAVIVGAVLSLALITMGVVTIHRIVRERNVAESRANDLRLAQARAVLGQDPTSALAWLRTHQPTDETWEAAATTALEARSAGVARWVLPSVAPRFAVFDPLAREVVVAGTDEVIAMPLPLGPRRTLLRLDAVVTALEVKRGRVAIGTANGEVHLIEGSKAWRVRAHEGVVSRLRFDKDDERLVSTGLDGFARLWDPVGHPLGGIAVPGGAGLCAGARGDEFVLATAGGHIVSWRGDATLTSLAEDVDACVEMFLDEGSIAHVSSRGVTLIEGGKISQIEVPGAWVAARLGTAALVIGDDGGRVIRLDRSTHQTQVIARLGAPVTAIATSSKGDRIAAAAGGVVHVLDTSAPRVLRGHKDQIAAVAFVDDAVVSLADDGEIRVWSLSAVRADALGDLGDGVYGMAWRDGSRIVTGSNGGLVTVWSLVDGTPTRLASHGAAAQFALGGDPVIVASTGDDGQMRVAAGETRSLLADLGAPATKIAVARDGTMVSAAARNNRVVWMGPAGGDVRTIEAAHEVNWLAFVPPASAMVIATRSGELSLIDLGTGAATPVGEHREMVLQLVAGPTGLLASASNDRTVRLWDVAARTSRVLPHEAPVLDVAFLGPERLVSSTRGGAIQIWNGDKPDRALRGHTGWVFDVAATADGRFVASAGADGTARLWDLENGGVSVLRGHEGRVKRVAFSPDGKTLATGGEDGRIRLWPVEVPRVPRERFHEWLDEATTAVLDANGRARTPTPQ